MAVNANITDAGLSRRTDISKESAVLNLKKPLRNKQNIFSGNFDKYL
jgi:hypothetical protein